MPEHERSPLLRLAAVEILEREENLGDLTPQRVFVAAKPVERVGRGIDQTQIALRNCGGQDRRWAVFLRW